MPLLQIQESRTNARRQVGERGILTGEAGRAFHAARFSSSAAVREFSLPLGISSAVPQTSRLSLDRCRHARIFPRQNTSTSRASDHVCDAGLFCGPRPWTWVWRLFASRAYRNTVSRNGRGQFPLRVTDALPRSARKSSSRFPMIFLPSTQASCAVVKIN